MKIYANYNDKTDLELLSEIEGTDLWIKVDLRYSGIRYIRVRDIKVDTVFCNSVSPAIINRYDDLGDVVIDDKIYQEYVVPAKSTIRPFYLPYITVCRPVEYIATEDI